MGCHGAHGKDVGKRRRRGDVPDDAVGILARAEVGLVGVDALHTQNEQLVRGSEAVGEAERVVCDGDFRLVLRSGEE